MSTVTLDSIDKKSIKAFKNSEHSQLKKLNVPMYFRYHKNRERGSYYYVAYKNGNAVWEWLGNYPEVSPDNAYKKISVRLSDQSMFASEFKTVDKLLEWYLDRLPQGEQYGSYKSLVNLHIGPALGGFKLTEISEFYVDKFLFVPMRKQYALSYVEQAIKLLKAVFNLAKSVKILVTNPLDDLKFAVLRGRTKVAPRESSIDYNHLPEVKGTLNITIDTDFTRTVFVMFMLLHGTRVGETRLLRWNHVNWRTKEINIPASITKTRVPLRIPLTVLAIDMLKQYKNSKHFERHDFLFGSPCKNHRGKPISKKTGYNWVKNISDQRWSPHELRKCFSDSMQKTGVSDTVRNSLLNHAVGFIDASYLNLKNSDFKRKILEDYHKMLKNDYGLRFVTKTIPRFKKSSHAHRLLESSVQ